MGIHSAVLHFNDGANGVEKVLSFFNISSGTAMEFKNNKIDCKRVRQMNRKLSDVVKRRRKTLRTIKQGYQDKENDTEKPGYIKGGFSVLMLTCLECPKGHVQKSEGTLAKEIQIYIDC